MVATVCVPFERVSLSTVALSGFVATSDFVIESDFVVMSDVADSY